MNIDIVYSYVHRPKYIHQIDNIDYLWGGDKNWEVQVVKCFMCNVYKENVFALRIRKNYYLY